MRSALVLLAALSLSACSGSGTVTLPEASGDTPAPPVQTDTPDVAPEADRFDAALRSRAARIAQEAIIVDGHIDVPYRLKNRPDDVGMATDGGDFDYPRAVTGGLDAPFMSIYIPAAYQETGGAKALADSLIDMVKGIEAQHPDKFRIATSVADVRANHRAGLISLPMGMENGAPVESDLANLEHFHARGIRYITLTHSKDNEISDSSYDTTGTHEGLSDFGREVVREMNRLGIMVDISHVSDSAFDDVMEVTTAPVIASHSSARRFTPGFERNLDDARIVRLAENGGVIMINFGSSFLTAQYQMDRDAAREHLMQVAEERGWEPGSDAFNAYTDTYFRENVPYADLSDVVAHIEHVVSLVGVDHVGLGSDYDGVGDSLPTGLKDVAAYPNLVAALIEANYTDEDIRKILGENALRVWAEVEQVAARSR